MNPDLNHAVIPLRKNELLRIPAGGGQRIECLGGSVWVTQDRDPRDIVLGPEQGFTLDRPFGALVGAFADARLLVLDAARA